MQTQNFQASLFTSQNLVKGQRLIYVEVSFRHEGGNVPLQLEIDKNVKLAPKEVQSLVRDILKVSRLVRHQISKLQIKEDNGFMTLVAYFSPEGFRQTVVLSDSGTPCKKLYYLVTQLLAELQGKEEQLKQLDRMG